MQPTKLPNIREFFAQLVRDTSKGRDATDISEIVSVITESQSEARLLQEFKRDPHQLDTDGNLRFELLIGDSATNALLSNESVSISENKIKPGTFHGMSTIREIKSGKFADNYYGPNVTLFPDTHIMKDERMRSWVTGMAKQPGIKYHVLPIVNYEQPEGGLRKRFQNGVPPSIARGQSSLEGICKGLNIGTKEELTLLYDTAKEYLGELHSQIVTFLDSNRKLDSAELAKRFSRATGNNSDDYSRFLEKIFGKYRIGNKTNHLADWALTTTCYGFNFISNGKSIVVSNDRDLIVLFDIFYKNVLPAYMAKTAIKAIKEKDPNAAINERDYVESAKKYIEWAKQSSGGYVATVGLLYVPNEQRFYTREVARPLTEYFNRVRDYRNAKNAVLREIAETKRSPGEIVRELMKRDAIRI